MVNYLKDKILKTKAQIKKALEKQKQSAIRRMERQREKQLEKQNSPAYRQEQFEKKKAAQERAAARMLQKQQDPEYKQKLIDKQNAKKEAELQKIKQEQLAPKPIKEFKKVSKAKTTGLAGRARKAWEIELHNQMAAIGCICCLNKGLIVEGDSFVSIHHVKGRTGPDAHEYCLPLCAYHHDQVLPKEVQEKYPQIFPVHAKGKIGGKVSWEKENGTQLKLVKQVWDIIGYKPKEHIRTKQLKIA